MQNRIVNLGREMRRCSCSPLWCDPRELAYHIGFGLAVGPEPSTAEMVIYPWDRCQRQRGRSVYLGAATGWLLRIGGNLDDVEALVSELAIPHEALQAGGIEAVLAAQEHYPLDLILAAGQRLAC